MPRSAYQVSLTQEPSTLNINDAAQRFARATAILMQIAQRTGLDLTSGSFEPNGLRENAGKATNTSSAGSQVAN